MAKRTAKHPEQVIFAHDIEQECRSIREEVLREAVNLTTTDRAAAYGDPARNMQCFSELREVFFRFAEIASADEAVAPACSQAHDGAIIMVLAKLARIACGSANRDNYVDAAAYLAIAWEAEKNV